MSLSRRLLFSFSLLTLFGIGLGRTHPKSRPLEEQSLSREPHEKDGRHNPEYDHQAFLGVKEAKHFNELSEKEAKQQLGAIFNKIDTNSDGVVTQDELSAWVRLVYLRERMEVVHASWRDFGLSHDQQISFSVVHPGYDNKDEVSNLNNPEHYLQAKRNLKNRWSAADLDNNGRLSKEEYNAYLHPADWEHMHSVITQEILEEVDKNEDGFISKEEYMTYLYPSRAWNTEDEPLIAREERQRFEQELDVDGDGQLDATETRRWQLPGAEEEQREARHLIQEADSNKDGKLSHSEVLDNWQLFVGSRVTGSMPLNLHEEL